jgi:hypothetical protein
VNRSVHFTNGTRLGGYEILSMLGAGGMGGDFGIAKITDPIDHAATDTPTMPAGPTREGTAIGTARYMILSKLAGS